MSIQAEDGVAEPCSGGSCSTWTAGAIFAKGELARRAVAALRRAGVAGRQIHLRVLVGRPSQAILTIAADGREHEVATILRRCGASELALLGPRGLRWARRRAAAREPSAEAVGSDGRAQRAGLLRRRRSDVRRAMPQPGQRRAGPSALTNPAQTVRMAEGAMEVRAAAESSTGMDSLSPLGGQDAGCERADLEERVRNALSVIVLASELIRRGPTTLDTQQRLASGIDQACERILEELRRRESGDQSCP